MLIYTSVHFFFFNDTATTEIYTLSLHDALPILRFLSKSICFTLGTQPRMKCRCAVRSPRSSHRALELRTIPLRSEEHTSELQSQSNLVCRLLLEKKKPNPTSLHQHDASARRNRD